MFLGVTSRSSSSLRNSIEASRLILLKGTRRRASSEPDARVLVRCLVLQTLTAISSALGEEPTTIPSYVTKEWFGGAVWYEEEYPNILFAKDGEIYDIENIKHLVIGGAYSVDKFYRLHRGYGWWADEQPSAEIKRYVEQQIKEKEFDVILSHTCPFKYEPVETFLPGIDQSTVDTSTEEWLDKIEEIANYKAWYCGHWHIDKRIDKMHFLYHGVETSDDIR